MFGAGERLATPWRIGAGAVATWIVAGAAAAWLAGCAASPVSPAGAASAPMAATVPAASSKAASGAPATPAAITVKVIGFNDYHGHLQSPGRFAANLLVPVDQRPPVGGAEYLAAYVARMKARNPLNVVVGAGDFIGASPLISSLFHDEPAVETLNGIGVEFNAVGNHEFDHGADELLRLQRGGCKRVGGVADANSCRGLGSSAPGRFDGAHFQWLSANVIERATGRTLLPPYGIKTFAGVPVAFIGMTLRGTPGIVVPTGVAGLEFRDEAATVNALVPALRARGIEAIVVLVHQGGAQESGGVGDINGCDGDLREADGRDSEIRAIVRRLDDAVDLVVSGHTHAAYNCSAGTVDVASVDGRAVVTPRPTGLPNARGRLVPVTSAHAYGRVLTDIDMTLDPATHDVLRVTATNRLVDQTDPEIRAAIDAQPAVRDLVAGYDRLVAPLSRQVIGRIAAAWSATPDDNGESPAGKLIADAQLRATQAPALGGAVAAFMNPGGVRHPGLVAPDGRYPHALTYGEAYTAQPFGNSLVTMTLSARELKDLLEQQFPGCGGQRSHRVLQVSAGVDLRWRASAAPCARIADLTITPTDVAARPPAPLGPPMVLVRGGVLTDPQRPVRITVNSFLAAGGDGFAVLRRGRDVLGGAQDLDALIEHLRTRGGAEPPPLDPADPAMRRARVSRLP